MQVVIFSIVKTGRDKLAHQYQFGGLQNDQLIVSILWDGLRHFCIDFGEVV